MSELPKGWVAADIGSLTTYVSRGKSPKYVVKSDLPVVNQKCVRWAGVDERHVKFVDPTTWEAWGEERFLQDGDILWNSTGTGTIGRAALYSGLSSFSRAVVDSHVTVLRANQAVHSAYLFRFVQSPAVQDRIESMQSGSTNQVELNRSEVVSTEVPLPPIAEQRRIVAKLDALTARTARARADLDRIPTLAARYKQAVLAKAFSGELTAEWREGTGGEAWSKSTIGEVVTIASGQTPKGIEVALSSAGEIPWFKVSSMNTADNLRGLRTSEFHLSREDVRRLGMRFVAPGSVTFPKRGGAIATNKKRKVLVEGVLDLNLMVLTAKLITPDFLWWWMQGLDLASISNGSSVPQINNSDVAPLEIDVPPYAEQAEIARRLEIAVAEIDRMVTEAAAARRLLDRLDQAVLAKAFRGELVPQDPTDEPASVLLDRIKAEREAEESRGGRRPNGSKEQVMNEKLLPPRDRILKDSESWPALGLPFEAIASRNAMPHDQLRDALFDLLAGPSPALQQRFDTDAELIVIQRVAA